MGSDDVDRNAIVCWNCGALVPLRVKIIGGKRVVLCACGKTNSLDTPDALRRPANEVLPPGE